MKVGDIPCKILVKWFLLLVKPFSSQFITHIANAVPESKMNPANTKRQPQPFVPHPSVYPIA